MIPKYLIFIYNFIDNFRALGIYLAGESTRKEERKDSEILEFLKEHPDMECCKNCKNYEGGECSFNGNPTKPEYSCSMGWESSDPNQKTITNFLYKNEVIEKIDI